MIRNCEYCSREFKTDISRVAKGYGKYCSSNCFGKSNRPKGTEAWNKGIKTGNTPANYKGENASYSAAHHWVKYHFGKATYCSECGLDKIPEGKVRYFEWANLSGKYLREKSDWVQMCVKCHRTKDNNVARSWQTRKQY